MQPASQVVRLRVNADGTFGPPERSGKLRDIIASNAGLNPFMDRRLEKNGLTIEGVAVRGGRSFAGFRAPSLADGRTPVLAVTVASLFDGGDSGSVLYRLPLGRGRGVRDLALYDDGILVMAGPSGDGPGAYSIYRWDGASENVRLLGNLTAVTGKKGKRKAEALLPLDQKGSRLRVLILFDGRKEGAPVALEIPSP